uniref:Regulator of G-protein signaling n=1 Tax=Chara braunii TaxID=69332 RepID=V5SQ35_CHABU|nr:regulator of G-protein signaling [Chara braunii]
MIIFMIIFMIPGIILQWRNVYVVLLRAASLLLRMTGAQPVKSPTGAQPVKSPTLSSRNVRELSGVRGGTRVMRIHTVSSTFMHVIEIVFRSKRWPLFIFLLPIILSSFFPRVSAMDRGGGGGGSNSTNGTTSRTSFTADSPSDHCTDRGGCPTDYIAAVVSAFVCGFILAAAILLYSKRNHTPFKAKQVPLMIWQSIGSILWVISLVLSRNLFSFRSLPWSACSLWIVWVGGLFGYGLWISCHFARVYRLYYVFVGRRLPPLNSLRVVIVLLMPWLLMAIVAEGTQAFENYNGICRWDSAADAVLSTMMGVYVAMFIVGTWLVRNIQFAFNEYHDLKKATMITVIFFGIWFMFYVVKNAIEADELSHKLQIVDRFTLVIAADIAALLFLWMPIAKPIRMLMDPESEDAIFLQHMENNQQKRGEKNGFLVPGLSLSDLDRPLERLLEKRMFLESFKKFAESRFAGEAVRFYEIVRERKKFSPSSTVEKVYLATYIIDKFIQSGAPEEINISSRMRQRVLSTSDLGGDRLFDEAVKEAVRMMKMNLEKHYRESEQFVELKKKVGEMEEAREQLERMNLAPKGSRRSEYRPSRNATPSMAESNPWALLMGGPPSPLNPEIWKPSTGFNLPLPERTAVKASSAVIRMPDTESPQPSSAAAFVPQSPRHSHAPVQHQQAHGCSAGSEANSPRFEPAVGPSRESPPLSRGRTSGADISPTANAGRPKGSVRTRMPAAMVPDTRIAIPSPASGQTPQNSGAGGASGRRREIKIADTPSESSGRLRETDFKPPPNPGGSQVQNLTVDIPSRHDRQYSRAKRSVHGNWTDSERGSVLDDSRDRDGSTGRRKKRVAASDSDLYPFHTYGEYLENASQKQSIAAQSTAEGGVRQSWGRSISAPHSKRGILGNPLKRPSRSMKLSTYRSKGYKQHPSHRQSPGHGDAERGGSEIPERSFAIRGRSLLSEFGTRTASSSQEDSNVNKPIGEGSDLVRASNNDPYDPLLSWKRTRIELGSSPINRSEPLPLPGWRGDAKGGEPAQGMPMSAGRSFAFPSFSSSGSSPNSQAFRRLPFQDSSEDEYESSTGGRGGGAHHFDIPLRFAKSRTY